MKQHIGIYFVVFMLGIGTGFFFTPEYAQMRVEKNSPMVELGMPDKFLDLRYLNNMIAHHLSAIDMADQALAASSRQEIIELAKIIIETDKRGIEQLYQYKREWYGDTREIKRYERTELGTADELFDLRFINALLAHHQMAIESARDVSQKSTRTDVLNLANEVETSLTSNAKQLSEWRKNWYEN